MTKKVVSLFLSLLMLLTLLPVSALADDGSSASEQPAEVSASTETKKDAEKPAADKASDETNDEKSSDEKTSEGSKEKAKTPTYTVKFVAYGKTVAKKTVKEGGTVSSLPHVTLQEESHVFKGWFYKEKGKDIRFTTSTVVSRDLTVEADIVTDPSSADTESVPASEPSDDDGQKAAPAAQTDVGQDSAPAAADGEGQNPAPAATDAEGQDPAPAANDGEGQDPAPAATDGEGQDPEDGKKDDDLTALTKDAGVTPDMELKAAGKEETHSYDVEVGKVTVSSTYDGTVQSRKASDYFSFTDNITYYLDKEEVPYGALSLYDDVKVEIAYHNPNTGNSSDTLSGTNVGSYSLTVEVTLKVNGSAVRSSQGVFIFDINPAPVTVKVTGGTSTIEYDGADHYPPGSSIEIISDPTGLYDIQDTMILIKMRSVRNVRRDADNNVISYKTGPSGSGSCENRNRNFIVKYECVQGDFTITPAPLTIMTGSARHIIVPDSEDSLTNDTYSVNGLKGSDKVDLKITGAQPLNTAGSSSNTYEAAWTPAVSSGNYDITENLGTLTVYGDNEVLVTVTAPFESTFNYDGKEHTENGYKFTIDNEKYQEHWTEWLSFDADEVANASTVRGTNVGDYTSTLKSGMFHNTNDAFKVTIEVVNGTMHITPQALIVETESGSKLYDGEPLTAPGTVYTKDDSLTLVADQGISVITTGSQTEIGISDNTYTLDYGTADPKNYFVADEKLGTLEVTSNEVVVDVWGAISMDNPYNGTEYVVKGVDFDTKHPLYDLDNVKFNGTAEIRKTDAGEYYMGLKAEDFENLDPRFNVTFNIQNDGCLVIDPCVVTVLISGKEYEEAYTGSEIVKPAYEILSVEAQGDIPFDTTKIVFNGENAVRGTNPGTYKLTLKEEMFSSADPNFEIRIEYEKLFVAILVITSPKVTINVEGNAFATEFDGTEHVLTVKTDGKAYLDGVEQEGAPFTVTMSVEGDVPSPYTTEDVYVRSDFSIKGTDPGFYDNINWKTHLSLANPDAEVEWNFVNAGPRLCINGEGQGSDLPVVTIRFKDEEVYYLEDPVFDFDVENLPDGESYPGIWQMILDADGNQVPRPVPVGEYTITGRRSPKPVPVGGTVPEDTYTLQFIPAKLTVKPLPVTVNISGENAVLPYTGELQRIEGFTATAESNPELEDSYYMEHVWSFIEVSKEAVFETEGIDPGEYPMPISEGWFTCTDPNMDVEFQLTDGKLTIVEAGTSRYTAELTPVMQGFEETDEIQYDTRSHYCSGITVSVKDSDGQSVDGFTVDEQQLKFIYTNLTTGGGNGANVGSYQAEIDPSSLIVIRDAEGRNVTALFDVTLNPKLYTIIPRQLEIKITGNKTEARKGTTATATGYTLEETLNGNFYGYLGRYDGGPVSSSSVSSWTPWYRPANTISVTGGPDVGKTFMGLGTNTLFEKDASRTNWDVTFTYEDGYVEILDVPAIGTINLKMGPSQTLTYDGKRHQILPETTVDPGELSEMTVMIEGRYTDRYIGTMGLTIGDQQYKLSVTFHSPAVSIVTETHSGTPNVATSRVLSCVITAADGTNVTNMFNIQIDSTPSELRINRFPIKLRLRNDHWETMKSRKVVVVDGKEYGEADSKANWLEILTTSTPDNITVSTLLNNQVYLKSSQKKGTLLTLSRAMEKELAGQNVGLYEILVGQLLESYNKWDGMEEVWNTEWSPNNLDRAHTYCYTFEWDIDSEHPDPTQKPANYYYQITPAPLSITADDKQKNYGEPDPELTVSVRGLISGEKLSDDKDFGYDISRFLAGEPEGEKVGAYPITILVWMSAHAGDDPINPPVQKKAARVTEKSVSDRRIDEEERPGVIIPEWPWEDEIDEVDGDPLTGCGHFDHNNYKLTVKDGVLKIYEELTLKGADHEWTYDGAEHSDPDVTLTAGTLSGGADTLTAQATGTIKDPGTAENPVGDDYAITRDGKTTITYTVNKEEHTEPLSDYYTVTTVAGTLTVTAPTKPGAITLTAGNGTKVYDGTALTNPEVKLTEGVLLEGDTLTATAGGSAIDVADTAANNNPVISYQIMRGDEDVTAEYTVTTVPGTLTVTPRTITLRSASAAKSYDGTPLRRNVPSRDITIGGQKFAAGEGASYSITGSQTEVGSSRNAFTYKLNANTTAGNYKITTSYGRLRIFDENILDEEVPLGLLGSFSFYFISDTDLAKEGKKNDAYKDIFAWIKENNARLGALAIVGSGNAVLDRNEKAAWKLIKSELANLKRSRNQLPYLNVAGENEVGGDELDYKTYSKNRLCEVSKKNEYNDGQIWYQPFPEQQLLFVGIGYEKLIDPQTATEEEKELQDKWVNAANSMINKYPEYSVVLVLNDFIEHDPASQKDDGRLTEFGKFIEEKLVAPNGNVALVLCGSAEGTARWNKKYGDRNVNAVMYNYQDDEENGLGFFRIITLNGEAGSITVSTYSPTLDKDSYDENNPDYDFYVIHDAF